MSDIMRTALKGGGTVRIEIDARMNGDFCLLATEEWARLTAIERAVIPADKLDAAEDPDALIRYVLTGLVRKVHMNWEARKLVEAAFQEAAQ